ncbi:MAG TPA: hypothetical protein VG860_18225 [Terriglobia bacterium]|jgi:hypothetical protein|nr:hypothetical protein [Terriglobia bacterium]
MDAKTAAQEQEIRADLVGLSQSIHAHSGLGLEEEWSAFSGQRS